MIKPEFWDDQKLADVTFCARLTYIALWNFSDDFGVVKGDPRWLKNQIFPYDDLPVSDFIGWLDELKGLDRILSFKYNGEAFFYMPKFLSHQKINRPSKEKRNPQPPKKMIEKLLAKMADQEKENGSNF
jgi:hypothetical protein